MAVSKASLEQRVTRFAEACARAGIKVTHQRMEIFCELAGTEEHPDAETIYQRVRKRVTGISRDTVYRTLATLEAQGLARRTEAAAGAARYDANTDRHHHFVCSECGRIGDFYSEAWDGLSVPPEAAEMGRVETVCVELRGRCRKCQARTRKRKTR
ncbi:MAG: transcriptional repressor [Planctomycetota bacterium]|nr:transcriptional repressor [Planctomycetota bacterium]